MCHPHKCEKTEDVSLSLFRIVNFPHTAQATGKTSWRRDPTDFL